MVINEEVDIDTDRIQMKELDTTIKHLKSNKAPGPDKCTTELFKLLSRDTKPAAAGETGEEQQEEQQVYYLDSPFITK